MTPLPLFLDVSEDFMDCIQHAGTAATAICTRCDHPLCAACAQERNGRNFCANCAEFLDRRSAQRPPSAGGAPARPASAPAPAPAPGIFPGPAAPAAPAAGVSRGQAPQGDVYQGQASQGDVYPGEAAAPADVYQGEAPQGDVHQGEAAPGDVYQGEAPAGDVYQGGAQQGPPSGVPIAAGPGEEAKEGGSTGRAILFGSVVGAITAGIWYGAVILTQYQFGILAIVIGWLVGVATVIGAGRGGSDVAILSLVIAAISMISGDYMINNHYYRKFTVDEIQQEEAFNDGDISDEDIALYLETSVGELRAELSGEELEEFRRFLEEEVADDYDLDEPEAPANLPLSQLPFWMEWWEFVFIGIGAVQAFRVPLGDEAG